VGPTAEKGVVVMQPNFKWDQRFLELAKHVASWSKDPSTQVGAVIVNDEKIVVGMGYNGFARGVDDSEERYNDRPTKYKLVVHAELNAVLAAGDRAKGATIYVWPSFGIPPLCTNCAKAVVQAGIKRVVGYDPDVAEDVAARWADEIETSFIMCMEAGVRMFSIEQGKESAVV
jgi:dCMP deaminase